VFPFVHSFGSVSKLDSEPNVFIRCVALLNEEVYSSNLVFHYSLMLGYKKEQSSSILGYGEGLDWTGQRGKSGPGKKADNGDKPKKKLFGLF
jgi:hypothetical protein